MIKRICQNCGKEFPFKGAPSQFKTGRGKYCSVACGNIGQKKRFNKVCRICGNTFEVRPSEVKRLTTCLNCRNEYHYGKTKKITVYCAWCGKSKKIIPSRYKKHKEFFCNPEHQYKRQSVHSKGNYPWGFAKKHKKQISERITVSCAICGKVKKVKPYKLKNQNNFYCSTLHFHQGQSEAMKGLWPTNIPSAKELWQNPKYRMKMSNMMIAKWQDPEYVNKVLKGRRFRPSSLEKFFDNLTPDIVKYTGDGTRWINMIKIDGRNHNPDFRIIGQKKLIELFGDYWHRNDNPDDLIEKYKQAGFGCLIFWESEVYKQTDKILEKVKEFIQVGGDAS